jgi:hypothetical protein
LVALLFSLQLGLQLFDLQSQKTQPRALSNELRFKPQKNSQPTGHWKRLFLEDKGPGIDLHQPPHPQSSTGGPLWALVAQGQEKGHH